MLNFLQDKDEAKTGKTYTVLVLDKNTIDISGLSPSTVYLFQVQALSPESNVGSNSVEEEFSTLPEGQTNGILQCFQSYIKLAFL